MMVTEEAVRASQPALGSALRVEGDGARGGRAAPRSPLCARSAG
jgi:hypothetical protein